LVAMAAHLSQFVTKLFRIAPAVDALAAATADQNPIFRFKVDFVRRRVLPNLKKIAPVADPELLESEIVALREQTIEKAGRELDAELATAIAAVELMRSKRTGEASSALEALKQWCAAHLHDPAYRHWVSFRFPETIDHFNLVQIERTN